MQDLVRASGFFLQHAAADLVELDALEQRAEVAFAEALVALALDQLEEDRADHLLGEDLQQQLVRRVQVRSAVDQDAQAAQVLDALAVVGQALVDQVEVGVDRVLELDAAGLHALDRRVDVVAAQGHVLDALAVVQVQVLGDLALVVAALVDRDADLAAGAGHGLALQAGQLALDVEVAHLAEVEEAL